MLNLSNVLEVGTVWNAQALHAIGVAPLLEMFFESASAPVRSTSTNFTLKLLAQSVQFIKPVGNGFSIPPHRQRFRIVLCAVIITAITKIDTITVIDLEGRGCFRQNVKS